MSTYEKYFTMPYNIFAHFCNSQLFYIFFLELIGLCSFQVGVKLYDYYAISNIATPDKIY